MIYTIERRKISGSGTVETRYEIREYEKRTKQGYLCGGKTIREVKEKNKAEDSLRRKGLQFIREFAAGMEEWGTKEQKEAKQ